MSKPRLRGSMEQRFHLRHLGEAVLPEIISRAYFSTLVGKNSLADLCTTALKRRINESCCTSWF